MSVLVARCHLQHSLLQACTSRENIYLKLCNIIIKSSLCQKNNLVQLKFKHHRKVRFQ